MPRTLSIYGYGENRFSFENLKTNSLLLSPRKPTSLIYSNVNLVSLLYLCLNLVWVKKCVKIKFVVMCF